MWIEELASDYAEEVLSGFDVATEEISDIKMFRKIALAERISVEVSLKEVAVCTFTFEGVIRNSHGTVVAKVDCLEYMSVAQSGAPLPHGMEKDYGVQDAESNVCIVKLPYLPLSYRVIPSYC